jgi:hypothetical protein
MPDKKDVLIGKIVGFCTALLLFVNVIVGVSLSHGMARPLISALVAIPSAPFTAFVCLVLR